MEKDSHKKDSTLGLSQNKENYSDEIQEERAQSKYNKKLYIQKYGDYYIVTYAGHAITEPLFRNIKEAETAIKRKDWEILNGMIAVNALVMIDNRMKEIINYNNNTNINDKL